jgi:hypothetical protein
MRLVLHPKVYSDIDEIQDGLGELCRRIQLPCKIRP